MSLPKQPIHGIVEVMDDVQHDDRARSLAGALTRLSRAREERGPVGVVDPFEIVAAENRLAASTLPRAEERRGLFRFSNRARAAADEV